MKRRDFLATCALPVLAGVARTGLAKETAGAPAPLELRAGSFPRSLDGISKETLLWGYNGTSPGPLLRSRKGDRIVVDVVNGLPESTTIHWHGVRVPHAMDGVPHVTQPPIMPGQRFRYEFAFPDSGTFWYHPHHRSFEQVGRGLFGPIIVEEERPVEVNQDLAWVIADLKIAPSTGEHAPFGEIREHAAGGRMGNLITVNGDVAGPKKQIVVRSGERIRLRLINSATARSFSVVVGGHAPFVVAFDGQAVVPHSLEGKGAFLGPGMRTDLVFDCANEPGEVHAVMDELSGRILAQIRYSAEPRMRTRLQGAPMHVTPNQLPRPDLKKPASHVIEFRGGNAGPPVIGMVDGKAIPVHEMQKTYGLAWTVNSHSVPEDAHAVEPMLTLKRGTSHVITMVNGTGFEHPMHLHGHFFQVLRYNRIKPKYEEWRDTVFMNPWDEVTIALVAGEPGDWMFHCHILEHAAAGMMGVIRIE